MFNNSIISETQQASFTSFVEEASSDFFGQEDGTWLKLSHVSPDWAASTLTNLAKRLKAYREMEFKPFPTHLMGKSVVVVDSVASHVFQAMHEAGCVLSYADYNVKERRLEGRETTLVVGDSIVSIPAYEYEEEVEPIFVGESRYGSCVNAGVLNAYHLVSHLETKTAQQKAAFMALYTGFDINPENPLLVSLKPFGADEAVYASAVFNFAESTVETTREFKLRAGFFISGIGEVSPETSLCLLGLQLAGYQTASQTQVDATINLLTQAWEEEDVYGAQMEAEEQLRTIRNSSVALVQVQETWELPYFHLQNNNNREGVLEAAKWYANRKIPFFTDKYATKRVVTRAGVAALWTGMNFSGGVALMQTINDVKKLSKLLNRGWNAVAIQASEGVEGTLGYRPYVDAALQIKYKDQFIRVKGDWVKCLFHNGRFANNGSGVGYTKTHFAYSVKKTLRGTFNSVNLKQGQTLEDVKNDLEKQLHELLQSNQVLKSDASRASRVLLQYNGMNLIEYRGLNQDILLSADKGSCFKVRKLATSNSLSVELTVIFFANDKEIKSRGLGIKAVLKDGDDILIKDDQGNEVDWQVSYNMETQKGTAARLHLYAEYLEQTFGYSSFYEPELGVIHTPDANGEYKVEDLGDINAPFYDWCNANMKSYSVSDCVALHYFKFVLLGHAKLQHRKDEAGILAEALAHPVNSDIRLVNPKTGEYTSNWEEALNDEGTGVHIAEFVQGILGHYPIQVEVSTPRENTGTQASTLEQVAATYAACPELGEVLASTGADMEDAVMGMVAMATGDPTLMLNF